MQKLLGALQQPETCMDESQINSVSSFGKLEEKKKK